MAPRIVFFLCDNLDEDVVKEDGEEDGEESPEDGEESPEGALEAAPEAEEKEEEDGEESPEAGEESPEDAVEDIEDGESKTLSIHIIRYKVVACFSLAHSFLPNVLAS